jgi:hypothetical protein
MLMSTYEFAAIFVTAILAIGKLFLLILQKSERPYTRQHFIDGIKKVDSLESIAGTIMLGIVMAVMLKIASSSLPRLEAAAERTERVVQKSDQTISDDIDRRLAKLERGLDAFLTLTETERLQEMLDQLSRAVKTVNNIEDKSIRSIFVQQFEWASSIFKQELISIRSSKVQIPRELVQQFGQAVVDNAKISIHATSYVDPIKWWMHAEGEIYLKKNADAVRKGVQIRRIFVFKTDEERKEIEGSIASAQKKAGVDVYLADVKKLPKNLQKDIIIMDGKLAGTLGISDRAVQRSL